MPSPESSALTPDVMALLGQEWVFTAPEEVSSASIRKFASAIGDPNPVYHDQDYALKTKYQGIVAPPTFVCETMQYLGGDLDESGTPARRPRIPLGMEIRGGNEYELFQPLRPQDVLTVRWRIADIRERDGRTGKLLFLVSEITYTNQRQEKLAVNRETSIFRDTGSQKDTVRQPKEPAPDEAVRQPSEPVPGDSIIEPEMPPRTLDRPLSFKDVSIGDEITPLCKEISLQRMVIYAAATWDFNRYHYDQEYARALGFAGPFIDGQMLGAFLAQMLADWAGDPGVIARLSFRFRDFSFPGDRLVCKGRVTGKSEGEDDNLVDCELWIEDQASRPILSPGLATLALP